MDRRDGCVVILFNIQTDAIQNKTACVFCAGQGCRLFARIDNNEQLHRMTIMDLFSNFKSAVTPVFPGENDNLTKLYDVEPYTAFSEDLEFMWRWTIYRDQKLVQEGCSLTLDASRRAVDHVLAFFSVATARSAGGA